MNLKIVYPLSVSRVNQDGSPYEFTENRFFDQTKLFVDYQRIDSGYVAKDDDNYYLIPDEAGVEINPEMHGFGNPDINEAYKRTENVSDYTKAYAAFGKDRSLDYSAQIDKDLLDTNTENILGVSLVKVDENYQPTQVMPSVIGPGEQKIPTNNALLKETLDLIRSHIANKSNAHAIESIVGLSSSLNQLVESISSVNTIANNSLEIAEGAATTASEAAQAINEHAEATTNPHPTNVTQEFADTQITPLAVEATYTPTVWSYLVGLFTTVPKSVKEHIVKGWTLIQDLSSRVTALESDIRDFSLTVTQNVSSVELTNLNISKGAVIHLTADWVYTADVPVSVYRLEFNNIVTGYMNTGVSANAYINLYTPLTDGGQTQAVIYFADTITALSQNIRKATGTVPTLLNLMGSRPNFPDNVINTIRIRTAESGKVIAAGTKINVKVIK